MFCLCHIYTCKELLFFMYDIYIESSLETLYVPEYICFFVWLFDYLIIIIY